MKTRLLITVIGLALAAGVSAQTKASGTLDCAKPDPMHMIEVGDMPGHAIVAEKVTCKWTKPMDVGGMPAKEGWSAEMIEVHGAKSALSGSHWGTVEGGDKYFVRYSGNGTSNKEGVFESASGAWKYTGGTGKLKGITGKGTYKGKGNADGSATFEVEGEWSLPAAKPAAKK
jgi:hypothetical protein